MIRLPSTVTLYLILCSFKYIIQNTTKGYELQENPGKEVSLSKEPGPDMF